MNADFMINFVFQERFQKKVLTTNFSGVCNENARDLGEPLLEQLIIQTNSLEPMGFELSELRPQ